MRNTAAARTWAGAANTRYQVSLHVILKCLLALLPLCACAECPVPKPDNYWCVSWQHQGDGDGFRVYYGRTSREYSHVITVDADTRHVLIRKDRMGPWYFAAAAFNANGESGLSNEVVRSYGTPAKAPRVVASSNRGSELADTMGYVFGGSGTPVSSGSPNNVSAPAGRSVGDLLLLMCSVNQVGDLWNAVTGWQTLVSTGSIVLYGRIASADANDDIVDTVLFGLGTTTRCHMVYYTGDVPSTLTGIVIASSFTASVSTTFPYAALTVPDDNALVVIAGQKDKTGTTDGVDMLAEAGFTRLSSWVGSNGGGHKNVWDYQIQTTAQNIAAGSWDFDGVAENTDVTGFTVALASDSALALVVQGATHSQTADANALTQAGVLAMADALHAHAADAVALSQANILASDDAQHGQAADTPTLIQAFVIELDDALHDQNADAVELNLGILLDANDALHAHSADEVEITQAHILVVQPADHAQSTDALTITQAHLIAVDNADHAQLADMLTLTQENVLSANGALHTQTALDVALTQAQNLSIANTMHAQSVDTPSLLQANVLVPDGAVNAQLAQAPTLSQANLLAIQDALHAQLAAGVSLTSGAIVVVSDALHAQFADGTSPFVLWQSDRVVVVRVMDRIMVVAKDDRVVVVEKSDRFVYVEH